MSTGVQPPLLGKRRARRLGLVLLALLSPQPSRAESGAGPYDWRGFYLGVNLGATTPLNVGEHFRFIPARGVRAPDLYPPSRERTGVSFGIAAGYNWRTGPLIYGVETDFNFLDGRGGRSGVVLTPAVKDYGLGYSLAYDTPASYFASLRGRLGTTIGDTLLYVTAGVATGGVRGPASLTFFQAPRDEVHTAAQSGSRRMKYVLGLGVEHPIANGFTAKFETLFLSQGLNQQVFSDGKRGAYVSNIRNENIVARVGVNRQFGAENVYRPGGAKSGDNDAEEIYSVHGVSTTVGQGFPPFHARYSGPNSFRPHGQFRSGTISDLFLGIRLWEGASAYANPEINQGYGPQNTVGAASYLNALTTRVGSGAPYLRMQRFFLRQIVGLGGSEETSAARGGESEMLDSTINQIARRVDKDRLTFTIGKYSVPDIFDDNVYAHDPTKDFLNYAFNALGAFDYAADAWGYTYGATAELKKSWWSARAGLFQLSQFPGRSKLDPILLNQFMAVGEIGGQYDLAGQPGALKFLFFSDNGKFAAFDDVNALAIATHTTPSVSNLRLRRQKNGFGVNIAQQLMPGVGLFLRAGANDGRYETVDYTDVNRSVAGGFVFSGDLWGREKDKIGLAASVSGISGSFARYLQLGGTSAFIGDGALRYGAEKAVETFYKCGLLDWLEGTLDYQFLANPGYNAARGPVNAFAVRLRAEF